MPQAYLPIQKLYLFPNYRTREEFRRATGKDAPAYDPGRPPKYWFDPDAANSPRRVIVYDNAFFPHTKPMLDVLLLKREDAAAVNIYEADSDSPAPRDPEVPTPIRVLKATEEVVLDPFGNPMVHDTNTDPVPAGGFTDADRGLLKAIADKLGVTA